MKYCHEDDTLLSEWGGTQEYPVCIIHHRKTSVDIKVITKQYLCATLPRRLGLRFIRK